MFVDLCQLYFSRSGCLSGTGEGAVNTSGPAAP